MFCLRALPQAKHEANDRRMDEQLELMHKNRQHFTAACDSMDKALKSKDKVHDEQLVAVRNMCEKTNEEFTDYRSDLEARISARSAAQDKLIEDNQKKLEHDLEAQGAAATKRVDALEAEHGKLIAANDSWIKARVLEVKREVDSNKQTIEHRVARNEKDLENNVELLRQGLELADERMSAKNEMQDTRLQELGMALDKTNTHFTDVCDALDRKMLYNAKQDDVIQQHYEYVFATCMILCDCTTRRICSVFHVSTIHMITSS